MSKITEFKPRETDFDKYEKLIENDRDGEKALLGAFLKNGISEIDGVNYSFQKEEFIEEAEKRSKARAIAKKLMKENP